MSIYPSFGLPDFYIPVTCLCSLILMRRPLHAPPILYALYTLDIHIQCWLLIYSTCVKMAMYIFFSLSNFVYEYWRPCPKQICAAKRRLLFSFASLSSLIPPLLFSFLLPFPSVLKFTYGRNISCHHHTEDVPRPLRLFRHRKGRAMTISRLLGRAHAGPGPQCPRFLQYIYSVFTVYLRPSSRLKLLEISPLGVRGEAASGRVSRRLFQLRRLHSSVIGQPAISRCNEIARL